MQQFYNSIDFGTTQVVLATVKAWDDRPEILNDTDGESHFHSTIRVKGQDDFEFAVNPLDSPSNTIRDNKRFIGQKFEDVKDHAKHLPYDVIKIDDETGYEIKKGEDIVKVRANVAGAALLQHFKRNVIDFNVHHSTVRTCIARPNRFNCRQTQATASMGM